MRTVFLTTHILQPSFRALVTAPMSMDRMAKMRAIFFTALLAMLIPQGVAAGQVGIASRYCHHDSASGRKMSCRSKVAAHRTIPFGTRIKVRNLANGRSVIVTIVDRGPFVKGRIIDLSEGAANAIGSSDLMRVEITRR